MSHEAASLEHEHKRWAISMEAVPKTMALQPIYSSQCSKTHCLGYTTTRVSPYITSPAYLVAWQSKTQRHMLPGMWQEH